ncbi:MAG: carbohydrate binding family 9 domain-containing protein [Gemmatimonadetes bacterium]|nr:carbohydrate binding family 9 domain-containing protein [Gemmatimonadota bacterium]
MRQWAVWAVVLGGVAPGGRVWAQAGPPVAGQGAPLAIQKLPGPIELDGRLDDAAWQAVDPLPLTMYFPEFRGTPEQRTEIRVAYDEGYFYAAGWFYDSEPEGIRINSLYRDRWNGDDAFAIYLDAFNDNQNAKWFGTTPGGIRFDLLVSDDGNGLNESWDTFWDAETTVTESGWFAEVRIPFSSLGVQADADGNAVMGLTVTRLVSRTGERVTFPAIEPRFAFRQPSVAQDIVLRDVDAGTPLYVTPYLLGGIERTPALDPSGRYLTGRSHVEEFGADIRYPFSGNLTLDLTLNTDFAQVEADGQQVNLDRFPLFFPEKRRFFQERSGIFDFPTGGGSRFFHSRRIGLNAVREPVPVLGGGRLVGRLGEWDVGLLNLQTEGEGISPSENFGVARLRRRALNEFSYIGVMGTSRIRSDTHNVALAGDAFLRVFGDHYLTLKWASSFDSDEPGEVGLLDRSHYYVNWDRRTNRGLAYTVSTTRSGLAFQPGLGFLPRRDYSTLNSIANWYFFTDQESRFRRVWPGALAFSTFRNEDGVLESGQYAVWMQWETKQGGGGWIEPKVFREDVLSPFTIAGTAQVPAGNYTFADLQLALNMASGRRLRAGLDARAGTYFDGTRAQVIVRPTWNATAHMELGGDYQYTRLRFDDRDQRADVHLVGLRIRTALDARASGNALVQYNSTTDALDLNVRLRYNFAEGTDLWLVYNEGLDTERSLEPGAVTRPPLSSGRSLILKYTHTFGR